MTTQTLVPNGLLDDLLICEHCDEPMKVSQGNKPPDYQCTKSASQPPGSCPTPTFNAKQLDHEILAEIADTLITPDTLERLVAATRRIPSSSADISESDSQPDRYAANILQFARDPQTYTRTEVLQQSKDFLETIIERITIGHDTKVIHFAIASPDLKIDRRDGHTPATSTSQLS